MAIQLYAPDLLVASSYLYCYPANGLISTNGTYTLSLWVNFPTTPATTISMFGFYNGTADLITTPTTAIQVGVRGTGNIDIWTWGGGLLVSTTGYTIPSNTWIHVTYTCTAISGGTQTHKVYINGNLNNTSTNATQIAGILTQFCVNGYPEATHRNETGTWSLDDPRCFDRVLSDNEILTMYSTKGSCDGIVHGAVCRYDLSESFVGSTVANGTNGNIASYDLSIQKNNLVLAHTSTSTAPTYVIDWIDKYERPTHS